LPTFTPPVTDGRRVGDPNDRSWAYFKYLGSWATGATVWRDQQGVWHESIDAYAGGATHAVHDPPNPSTVTAPDAGVTTAQVAYDGGYVHTITDAEAADLTAAGYGDRIDIADLDLVWQRGQESKVTSKLVMSTGGVTVTDPAVEDSQFVVRATSGPASPSQLREFYLLDGTNGWDDCEVYCDGINPPHFGANYQGLGVDILPQTGVVLRAGFNGSKNTGITLNNNVFLGLPMLNVGVWHANTDGTGFQNRQFSWDFFESLGLPYGFKATLVGTVVTVSIFPLGHGPKPNDPTKTKVIDLEVDAGDAGLIPTPASGKCGFISAHLGFDSRSLVRVGHTTFRRL